MKKLIISFCFAVLSLSIAVTEDKPQNMRVGAIVGSSGLGMAYLFANPPNLGPETTVSFETVGAADVLLPKLLKGDIDVGILPPNVAAKLYNLNPESIVVGAIVGNGMISLVTRDPAIRSLADLAGKTVSVAGQGATPEYVTRTLLAKSGLPLDSVTLDFSIPNAEIAAALVSDKIAYAIIPEPFATIAVLNGSVGEKPVRRAVSLRDVWKSGGLGDDYPMTLCVIRKGFAKKYPDSTRLFLESYRASIAWTVANPSEAGKFVESANLGLKAQIAAKAIPSCNFVFVPAIEAQPSIEQLLSVFLRYAPEAVGGKLPNDSFYFK